MIPVEAVEAAVCVLRGPVTVAFSDEDLVRKILEAAAPYLAGYRGALGDDDNPHRDGDVQPTGSAK